MTILKTYWRVDKKSLALLRLYRLYLLLEVFATSDKVFQYKMLMGLELTFPLYERSRYIRECYLDII